MTDRSSRSPSDRARSHETGSVVRGLILLRVPLTSGARPFSRRSHAACAAAGRDRSQTGPEPCAAKHGRALRTRPPTSQGVRGSPRSRNVSSRPRRDNVIGGHIGTGLRPVPAAGMAPNILGANFCSLGVGNPCTSECHSMKKLHAASVVDWDLHQFMSEAGPADVP